MNLLKLILMRMKLYKLYAKDKDSYQDIYSKAYRTSIEKKIIKLEHEIFTLERELFYKQTCFVFCPRCGLELTHSNSLVKDTDFVYYKCSRCEEKSKWDFDCPCPILIEN